MEVVNSECWIVDMEMAGSGYVYSAQCDDGACCNSKYTVCYERLGCGVVRIKSISRTSWYDPMIDDCEPPCKPDGCRLWRPSGGTWAKAISNDETNLELSIFFNYNNLGKELSIRFVSSERGRITIKFMNLLGQVIMSKEYEKVSELFDISIQIESKYPIFFIVNLNGNQIHNGFFYKVMN